MLIGCTELLAGNDIVGKVFEHGDFIPHVLTDKQLVVLYGDGAVTRSSEGINRTYFDPRCKSWLSASIQSDSSPEYRIIQELTISSLPLPVPAPSYRGKVCSLKLGGIALGDPEDKIFEAGFGKGKKEEAILAGRKIMRIRLNPLPNESDLYYLFYVRDSLIVGMAIGVTE